MTIAITGLVVRLAGAVAADVTALEVDGAAVAIAADRTWTTDVAVPATGAARYVAVTAIAPARVETRLVSIERLPSAPTAGG